MEETRNCNTEGCPVDCKMSAWNASAGCSTTCGGGQKTETRTVLVAAQNGGETCPSIVSRKVGCNDDDCPVDCEVSSWKKTNCSKDCDGGKITKTRAVETTRAFGGKTCPGLTATEDCNVHDCPIDCKLSPWDTGVCSKTCGGGWKTDTRTVLVRPAGSGKQCPIPLHLKRREACNPNKCEQGPKYVQFTKFRRELSQTDLVSSQN